MIYFGTKCYLTTLFRIPTPRAREHLCLGLPVSTFIFLCCVIASMAVICARIRAEVKMRSTGMSQIRFPASSASSTPFCDSGTSTHPVKRFLEFHNDSPCRMRMRAADSATGKTEDGVIRAPSCLLISPRLSRAGGAIAKVHCQKFAYLCKSWTSIPKL